jgi:hypothetical protein
MNGRGVRPPRSRRPSTARRRWLLIAIAVGSALVLALSAGLQAFLGRLNGNIATESMTILGKLPPPSRAGVLNILALGSQTRDGQGPVQALLGLAESLRPLKLRAITFVTLPNSTDPANRDRLLPREPQAAQVWQLLRADLPWTAASPPLPPPRTLPAPRAPSVPRRVPARHTPILYPYTLLGYFQKPNPICSKLLCAMSAQILRANFDDHGPPRLAARDPVPIAAGQGEGQAKPAACLSFWPGIPIRKEQGKPYTP